MEHARLQLYALTHAYACAQTQECTSTHTGAHAGRTIAHKCSGAHTSTTTCENTNSRERERERESLTLPKPTQNLPIEF